MSYEDLSKHYEDPIMTNSKGMEKISHDRAKQFLKDAVADVNSIMGDGAAGRNMDTVIRLVRVRTELFNTLLMTKTLQEGLANISSELDAIWDEVTRIVK